MLQKILQASIVVVALAAASCSPENPLLTISGSVTLDGVPLPEGDIVFTPADPRFGSEGAKIKDGTYQAGVRKGTSKVQIRATRPVPGKKGPMGEQLIEDYIPAKYNDATTLTIEAAGSQLKHDFALKSK